MWGSLCRGEPPIQVRKVRRAERAEASGEGGGGSASCNVGLASLGGRHHKIAEDPDSGGKILEGEKEAAWECPNKTGRGHRFEPVDTVREAVEGEKPPLHRE